MNYTQLFQDQANKVFAEHPDSQNIKVFYILRSVIFDEEERRVFGDLLVEIKSLSFDRDVGIAENDAAWFDAECVPGKNLLNGMPQFYTKEFAQKFPNILMI
jgi:hypothetical protein